MAWISCKLGQQHLGQTEVEGHSEEFPLSASGPASPLYFSTSAALTDKDFEKLLRCKQCSVPLVIVLQSLFLMEPTN